MPEIDAGVVGRELPGHGTRRGVAVSLSRCDFCRKSVDARDAPVEALFGQDGKFHLDDDRRRGDRASNLLPDF
jgi:hypothetical protein